MPWSLVHGHNSLQANSPPGIFLTSENFMRRNIRASGMLSASLLVIGSIPALAADQLVYTALAQPCRLLDTRAPGPGPLDATHGAYLFGASDGDIQSAAQNGNSHGCSIPSGATAISVNMNLFNATAAGNIFTWASDASTPAAGTATYNPSATHPAAGQVLYNGASATVVVGAADRRFNVSVANGQLDMTINVIGFWTPLSVGSVNSGDHVISWGSQQTATGSGAAAGGYYNLASGTSSLTVGSFNTASGTTSIALGDGNNVGGFAGFATGNVNTVTGAHAVAMGFNSSASGMSSFALGDSASSESFNNAFAYSDGSASTLNTADKQFMVRAAGGFVFYTGSDTTTGTQLAAGSGSWTALSDRNAKTAVQRIDGRDVLDRVVAMPLATWQYKTQDSRYRHMGPMAQDFYAAFGLGESDRGIDTIDADGVALAAIQGLHAELQDRDRDIAELRAQVAELAAAIKHPAGVASP